MEGSKKQYEHYKLSVENILERYNWSNIAHGSEVRPGGTGGGQAADRNSIATQIIQWDMRDKALKEFLLLSLPAEWKGKFSAVAGGGRELWQAIISEFEKETLENHTKVLVSLYNLTQGDEESVDDYVSRLKAIVQNLKEIQQEVSTTTTVMCFFNGLNATNKPEDVSILLEQQLTLDQAVSLVQDFGLYRPRTASVQATVVSPTSPLAEACPAVPVAVAVPIEKDEASVHSHGTVAAPPKPAKTHSQSTSQTHSHSTHTTTRKPQAGVSSPSTATTTPSSTAARPGAPRTAFELTTLHRGLKNNHGEHNCFLNVTIQALWHLGPFRTHLTRLIDEHSSQKQSRVPSGGLLEALCNLFLEYEFTDRSVLPATELRTSLAQLSDHFRLGEIADANEALDVILQRIHTELCSSCPASHKCLSHEVFGGCIMEQSICQKCNASSEPALRSDFILCFQAAELLLEAKALFAKFSHDEPEEAAVPPNPPAPHGLGRMVPHMPHLPPVSSLSRFLGCARRKPVADHPHHAGGVRSAIHEDHSAHHYANTEFGHILSKCMQLNHKSCPSRGAVFSQKVAKRDSLSSTPNTTNSAGVAVAVPYECTGRASVHQYSLDPPLAVALSMGWTQANEPAATLQDFYDIIAPLIKLSDLFSVQSPHPSPHHPSHTTHTVSSTHTNGTASAPASVQRPASTVGGVSGMKSPAGTGPDVSGADAASARRAEEPHDFLWSSPPVSPNNPAYVFRGLVCYYGMHYVSIFQGSEDGTFLLFDDYTVKKIGDWNAVKIKCVRSMYQPVLLLYELEKR